MNGLHAAVMLGVSLLVQGCSRPAALPAETAFVRDFVQGFYDWYVPATAESNGVEVVLKSKPELLSSELLAALREDVLAQDRSPDRIVGLDFDPFLDAQDPARRYAVSKVEKADQGWTVTVRGIDDEMSPPPVVVAKVQKQKGTWQFTNFVYEDGGDLLAVLQRYKRDREK